MAKSMGLIRFASRCPGPDATTLIYVAVITPRGEAWAVTQPVPMVVRIWEALPA